MSTRSYAVEYYQKEEYTGINYCEEEITGVNRYEIYGEEEGQTNHYTDDLISYCRNFINSHFYGERIEYGINNETFIGTKREVSLSFYPSVLNKIEKEFTIKTDVTEDDTLGSLLKLFHLMLISKQCGEEKFVETDDVIFQHLVALASLRKQPGEKTNNCFKRLLNDCKQFLQIYDKYAATGVEVKETHWGSIEQLRSGKVISDFVINSGHDIPTMDPIFGVLLCPYAGQITDTSSRQLLSPYTNEAISYHKIMYDAFHFLYTYHNIGPGKDYLGAFTLFHADPLSAEATSLLFWQRQFNRITEEGLIIKEIYF